MKNIKRFGLFDDHFFLEKLTKLGDPLQRLNEFINWKIFESSINEIDKVPDNKTFWLFREQLIEKNIIMGLFKTFNEIHDSAVFFANEGKRVDAMGLLCSNVKIAIL